MKYTIADSSSLSRFVRSVRQFPHDVVVALGFVAVADVAALSLPGGPVRTLLGLPLLLFVPGYALVSALFPGRHDGSGWRGGRSQERTGLPLGERAALAVGTSLALLPPLALVTSLAGLGFDTGTVVVAASAVSVVGLLVATVRRWQLPARDRFRVPARRWLADRYVAAFRSNRFDAALNLLLAVAVLLAATGVTYALVAPPRDQPHTEFLLLAENDAGELVSSGYPTEMTQGEDASLAVRVENYEGSETSYTVVVELQRVSTDGGSVAVLERQPVTRLQSTVPAGEAWQERHAVAPELLGTDLRLTYYLYQGEAPAEPDAGSADEVLFTWVNVTGE